MRGLRTKLFLLRQTFLACDYDIIVLSETWLNENFLDSEICHSGYMVYRYDRNSKTSKLDRGGGVLIAVRSNLKSHLITNPDVSIEQLFVNVSDLKLTVGAVYIPPQSPEQLYGKLSKSFVSIRNQFPDSELIFVGDFNLPLVDWHNSCLSAKFSFPPSVTKFISTQLYPNN